jgi:hypothetical protein
MPPQPQGSPPPPLKGLTLLGGPSTGKTTFLAALQIALLREQDLGWTLDGNNPASTQAMVRFMDIMSHGHSFPKATTAQMEEYKWSLAGDARKVWTLDGWRPRRRTRVTKVPLHLTDGPGGAADNSGIFSSGLAKQLIASMADSAGLIIFFDPLTEVQRGQAFQHLYGALMVLRSQVGEDGKLPHHVAVCITKFDSIPVYRSALALRLLSRDPVGQRFPYVPEKYAKEFLENLLTMSSADNASLILPTLKSMFHEDRMRFFTTSAIGFYVDTPGGMFDPDDYQNHIPGKPDRIRGGVYPINVVEPVLWLSRIVARVAR